MDFLLPLAAKSLLIGGVTLLLLHLMKRRSAADRSWIAHLGLAAIVALPLALLLLPQLEVATSLVSPVPVVETAPAAHPSAQAVEVEAAGAPASAFPEASGTTFGSGLDWPVLLYGAPAALLLLFTLIALLRLVVLKSKANVLVEPNWLTALARAQQRMGFKHGTALLTSDDLRSPISWGLMRPVILLNSEAADAHEEAEAIIAHELAHVARLDWVKLLLSRVAVALFWFNPFVWLLAREAHQLREEAADDAVLGSNIEDTEYARLLVGIARHECRGLLLGAHGVAPARTSLARRVQRVLDVASSRAPGGWRWTAAAGFFAAGLAVPLATLQFVPMSPASANIGSVGGKRLASSVEIAPPAIAGVASAAIDAASAVTVTAAQRATELTEQLSGSREVPDSVVKSSSGSIVANYPDRSVVRSADGSTITNYRDGRSVIRAPDGSTITNHANGQSIVRAANGATAIANADGSSTVTAGNGRGAIAIASAQPHPGPGSAIDRAIESKAVGVTPEYIRSLRAAAPNLRLSHDDIVELKALGVSPAYLRELAGAGLARLNADEISEARALGITGDYIRSIAASGYGRLTMDQLTELKALGVTARDVERVRRANGGRLPSVDRMVELKALGITPEDLEALDEN